MPTGGELLIAQLASEGVRHVFTVPGESVVPALDALHGHTAMRPVTCRTEQAAAMMAEATGKLTGRPGVAMVARGPGAVNALAGVYIAQQDATPMLLIVGLPKRALAGLPAFQAVDLAAVFGGVTRWCATVPSAARIPEFVNRAVRTALSGRPGPVVLGVPEDVLQETVAAATLLPRAEVEAFAPSPAKLAQVRAALAHAERPLLIVGGSQWSAAAAEALATFAERFDIPVVSAFRRQDHFDNRHRCYAGHAGLAIDPSLRAGLNAADVVIALGTRLGDVTTHGFNLFDKLGSKLIVIGPDASAPETRFPSALAIPASAAAAAEALAALDLPGKVPPWSIWRRDLRAAYLATLTPQSTAGAVRLEQIVPALSAQVPAHAIICNGAGNYAAFVHRYFAFKSYPSQLAPISGSMGYGLPAAIAAKLAAPERPVIAFAGDGCFQMTGQELATAVQFGLPLILVIVNNGALGTIRMHQERLYPGRVVATSLLNPDFVALAESYGAFAERIETTADFAPALARAVAAGGPAVLELRIDLEAISPGETLSGLGAKQR